MCFKIHPFFCVMSKELPSSCFFESVGRVFSKLVVIVSSWEF